jgi:hypothetical protein
MTEVRKQMTEVRGQRTENRRQKPEDGYWNSARPGAT